jgi:hypothetical protein
VKGKSKFFFILIFFTIFLDFYLGFIEKEFKVALTEYRVSAGQLLEEGVSTIVHEFYLKNTICQVWRDIAAR